MKKYIITLIILLAVIGLIYFGSKIYFAKWITNQNEVILLKVDTRIAKQEALLFLVLDLAEKNGADEIVKKIIVDCSFDDRNQFDTLLDKLSETINSSELKNLNNLFYKCGSFYSDRKAVMSARLQREVDVYSDYISLRNSLLETDDIKDQDKVELWSKLAKTEWQVSEDFNHLVKLQGDIIASLLAGNDRDSSTIKDTLNEVQITRDNMTVGSKQIVKFRQQLQAI